MTRTLIASALALGVGMAAGQSMLALSPAQAQNAAAQTASFAVDNMTCALCPATVKSAMARVKGVQSVKVDLGARTATVVFDPAVATIEAIAAASTKAGFPAAPT